MFQTKTVTCWRTAIRCACTNGSTIRLHGYHHPHKQTGIAAPRDKANMGMCTASVGSGNRRRWFRAHWGKSACISSANIHNASGKGPTTNYTSNGSWRQGIKGEMTCTVYVALVWDIIYWMIIITIIIIIMIIIKIIITITTIITMMMIMIIIIILIIIIIIIIMIIK